MQNYIAKKHIPFSIDKVDHEIRYGPLCMTKTYLPFRCWGLKKSCSSNSTRSVRPFDTIKASAASRVAGRSWTINFLISGYLNFRTSSVNERCYKAQNYLLGCKWAAERSLTSPYINDAILAFSYSIPREISSNPRIRSGPNGAHAIKKINTIEFSPLVQWQQILTRGRIQQLLGDVWQAIHLHRNRRYRF